MFWYDTDSFLFGVFQLRTRQRKHDTNKVCTGASYKHTITHNKTAQTAGLVMEPYAILRSVALYVVVEGEDVAHTQQAVVKDVATASHKSRFSLNSSLHLLRFATPHFPWDPTRNVHHESIVMSTNVQLDRMANHPPSWHVLHPLAVGVQRCSISDRQVRLEFGEM